MFIRLRQANEARNRVVLNSDFIVSIEARNDGSSEISLSNSAVYAVEESERKIRSLLAGAEADSE